MYIEVYSITYIHSYNGLYFDGVIRDRRNVSMLCGSNIILLVGVTIDIAPLP